MTELENWEDYNLITTDITAELSKIEISTPPIDVKPNEIIKELQTIEEVDETEKIKTRIVETFNSVKWIIPTRMGISKLKESKEYNQQNYKDALYRHLIDWFSHLKELNTGYNFFEVKAMPMPFKFDKLPKCMHFAYRTLTNEVNKETLHLNILKPVFQKSINPRLILTQNEICEQTQYNIKTIVRR